MESKRKLDPDDLGAPDDEELDFLGARSLSEALGEIDSAAALLQSDFGASESEAFSDFAASEEVPPIDALTIDQLLASGQKSRQFADAHAETYPGDYIEDLPIEPMEDLIAPEIMFPELHKKEA